MTRHMLVFLLALALALPVLGGHAHAQSVLEQLRTMEQFPKETAQPRQHMTEDEFCKLLETRRGQDRCRNFYLAAGYSIEWKGQQTGISHGGVFEILVRGGSEAVLCSNIGPYPLDDFAPCLPLQKAH